MIAPFDIFKTDKEGTLLWCGEASSLDEAKMKVQHFLREETTDYVIFSQKTGNRLVIQPDSP
jgi:hypothetical protein